MKNYLKTLVIPCVVLMLTLVIGGCSKESEPEKKPREQGGSTPPAQQTQSPPTTSGNTNPTTSTESPIKIAPQPVNPFNPAPGQAGPEALVGRWVADGSDLPPGLVKITAEFKVEGEKQQLTWSETPLIGEPKTRTDSFDVNGQILRSRAMISAGAVDFRIAAGKLIIEDYKGTTVAFRRAP